jgi:hypothetical protein
LTSSDKLKSSDDKECGGGVLWLGEPHLETLAVADFPVPISRNYAGRKHDSWDCYIEDAGWRDKHRS